MYGFDFLLVLVLTWVIPIVFVIFLFRTLTAIVEGMRSINAGVQRTAAAVEAMARRTPPTE